MTPGEFANYLLFAAILFGLLGVANLARPAKRWLGAGAILLGVAAMLQRGDAPKAEVAVSCVLALACMAKDVASRAGRPRKRGAA